MPIFNIQLIPDMVALNTKVKSINCFSFWDKNQNRDFFQYNPNSLLEFEYSIERRVPSPPLNPKYQFSNFSYDENKWYFKSQYRHIDFSFVLDEKQRKITSNFWEHQLFIKISWIEPIGYILSNYIGYFLSKEGISYHPGASGILNGKTFIFFGFGKNFKTTIVNMILQKGGFYIGEEFILLNNNKVYSTIPNLHRFDFRESHRKLFQNDLKKKKANYSEYDAVIFLVYSKTDKIVELDFNQSNIYAEEFNQYINSSYFNTYLRAKDFLEEGPLRKKKEILTNKKARFFIIYFTKVDNAFNFINEYR